MAITTTGTDLNPADANVGNTGGLKVSPDTYTTLADLIEPNKPDVQDLYVSTYGDQGITGFLELTGAKKNAGTAKAIIIEASVIIILIFR